LQAVNSYLAWDRRTRVTCLAESLDEMWSYIGRTPLAELPDVILLDADGISGADTPHNAETLRYHIERLRHRIKDVLVICLARTSDARTVDAAASGRARLPSQRRSTLQIAGQSVTRWNTTSS